MTDPADILEAVKRERERCAKIAETVGCEAPLGGETYIARKIADAIRVTPDEEDDDGTQ